MKVRYVSHVPPLPLSLSNTLKSTVLSRSEVIDSQSTHIALPYATSNSYCSYSSCTSSSNAPGSFDFLAQFSPLSNSGSPGPINSNERRIIAVALSKIVKQRHEYVLKLLSENFCPFLLLKIMKLFRDRRVSLAFFKYTFINCSDCFIQSCCLAAHLLAAEGLNFEAQDMLSWVVVKIGADRCDALVELAWNGHRDYESDFSILDSLMRAFLNSEMPWKALAMVNRMRKVGVVPSSSAVSILFKILIRVGDYGSVWKLFRDMVQRGPPPNDYNFRIMILGFCQKGYLQIGESLLHVMPKFRCEPNVIVYNIVINAYCMKSRTMEALNWVPLMIERGCNPSSATFNTIIHALCKVGNMLKARNIFDQMPEIGVSPNTITFNILMDGYVKAKELGSANMIYEEMGRRGIPIDGVTINILVAGHYRCGRGDEGDRLLRNLLMSSNGLLYDISIVGLCWAGKLDEAMVMLENMLERGIPLRPVDFNSIIAAYSSAGLENKAFEVFRIMVKSGVIPSSSTCSSLLIVLSKKGMLKEARELLGKMMGKGFPVNKLAFTVLIDGYFKTGDVLGAQNLWKEMDERGYSPDAVALSVIVDGLSKAGLVEEAHGLFLEILSKGVMPSNNPYNSLIDGLCKEGKVNDALNLQHEMREKGLFPDIFTANIIMNGFCRQGRMDLANTAFMDMYQIGLTPDVVTYNTLITGYCNLLDMVRASSFFNEMQVNGCNPNVRTYNILIHGFSRSSRLGQAVRTLDELVSEGLLPNTVTFTIIMGLVCRLRLKVAMILTAKLLKVAFVPDVATANLFLSQFCKEGFPDWALMWGQKLSEICFEFDEITYKVMDGAYRSVREYSEFPREPSERCHFLDFLMYMTCEYLCRYKQVGETSDHFLRLVDYGFSGS